MPQVLSLLSPGPYSPPAVPYPSTLPFPMTNPLSPASLFVYCVIHLLPKILFPSLGTASLDLPVHHPRPGAPGLPAKALFSVLAVVASEDVGFTFFGLALGGGVAGTAEDFEENALH